MKAKNKKFKSTLSTAKYALSLVWQEKYGKTYIALKMLIAIFNAVTPMAGIVLPGLIINELSGNRDFEVLGFYVAVLLAVPLLGSAVNLAANKVLKKYFLDINTALDKRFNDFTLSMDYETVENPDIRVKAERADRALQSVLQVVDRLSQLVLAVVNLILISSIVAALNPVIILLIILLILINSRAMRRTNIRKHAISEKIDEALYEESTYSYQLANITFAKEIRLFQIQDLLVGQYIGCKKRHDALELKYALAGNGQNLLQAATSFLQQAILYLYLVYRVIAKGMAVGSLTIYLSAAGKFSSSLKSVFDSYNGIVDQNQKIRQLREYLSIQPKWSREGLTPVFDQHSVIEFKNVSFRYPGSEKFALQNLNLTIRANERLCIVGENGSGKSTFTKLLMRLYEPASGEILLNGVNVKEYDYAQYQRMFAPVFQDFAIYVMPLKDNIVMAEPYDEARLQRVCEENQLKPLIASLDKGLNTSIEKWLDPHGVDPSGGERQKIAIARACYHDGDIFVLDEPTAALDPLVEYEMYSQFHRMITDKCAVLITHRLSAVQLADRVAVFQDGAVAEYGTHAELYAKGGIYTEMFDKQSEFYVKAKGETAN